MHYGVDQLREWLEKHFPEYALDLTYVDYLQFMHSEHRAFLFAWVKQPILRQKLNTEGIPTYKDKTKADCKCQRVCCTP